MCRRWRNPFRPAVVLFATLYRFAKISYRERPRISLKCTSESKLKNNSARGRKQRQPNTFSHKATTTTFRWVYATSSLRFLLGLYYNGDNIDIRLFKIILSADTAYNNLCMCVLYFIIVLQSCKITL